MAYFRSKTFGASYFAAWFFGATSAVNPGGWTEKHEELYGYNSELFKKNRAKARKAAKEHKQEPEVAEILAPVVPVRRKKKAAEETAYQISSLESDRLALLRITENLKLAKAARESQEAQEEDEAVLSIMTMFLMDDSG